MSVTFRTMKELKEKTRDVVRAARKDHIPQTRISWAGDSSTPERTDSSSAGKRVPVPVEIQDYRPDPGLLL